MEGEATKISVSEIKDTLNIQLEEVEMLQSMFSNPGELEMLDHGVVFDIKTFIEGKSIILPPRLDFVINLAVEENKLKVGVNFPLDYPTEKPDLYVRSDSLTRAQQHEMNNNLAKYVSTINKGEICVYPSIAWLQENAVSYFIPVGNTTKINADSHLRNVGSNIQFSRYWIYSHHIYSKLKRKDIIDLAQENNVTGFCLPGKPGIICIEGWEADCSDWWQRIRNMTWKKIMCKKKEEQKVPKDASIESLRKFSGFQEISFDNSKNKSRNCHMDMGDFYKYLSNHECSYVFRDYFGFEGRTSETVD